MWRQFKKWFNAPPEQRVLPNKVEKLVNKYVEESSPEGLRDALAGMNRVLLDSGEQEAWFRYMAVVEYRLGNKKKAFQIIREGVEEFPDSDHLNFFMGEVYEKTGRFDKALEHFKKVHPYKVEGHFLIAIAGMCYLWDYPALGQRVLDDVFQRYYELRIADDHRVFMRGLPFFGVTFGHRVVLSKLEGDLKIAFEEFQLARRTLRDYEFDHDLGPTLKAWITGNWRPVIESLTKSIRESEEHGYPSGEGRMAKAVHESRLCTSRDDAFNLLDSVKITESHSQWLEDVRTLAKAEACHRHGDAKQEQGFLQDFFSEQPKLFEPDNVFWFNFYDYQEKLKPIYRDRVRDEQG